MQGDRKIFEIVTQNPNGSPVTRTENLEHAADFDCCCGGISDNQLQRSIVIKDWSDLSNKKARFQLYQFSAHLLRYKRREKLPKCIEKAIKDRFPEEGS